MHICTMYFLWCYCCTCLCTHTAFSHHQANGPLAWASVAFSNKLVFHNFEWTTTLFIHFSPAVASWGLHWFREESEKVWGTRFDLVADASAWDVFSAGWYYYIFWWVLFTTWMLTRGLYYPEKGYDTVFNALKKALKFDQAAPFKGKSLRMQIVIYMVGHFIACTLAFAFSILVWNSFWLHTLFINFCLVMSLVRGSSWYVYAMKNAAVKQIALLEESFEEAQHEDTQTGNQQKKDK